VIAPGWAVGLALALLAVLVFRAIYLLIQGAQVDPEDDEFEAWLADEQDRWIEGDDR
jgi:hypothetical protein